MKIFTGLIMLAGLGCGFVMWVFYMDAAESAIHEIFACAQAMLVIVGAYVLARALDNFSDANRQA